MRTYVELPGGKLKRIANRKDGGNGKTSQQRRFRDEDEGAGREPQNHRRDRRVTRQLLRINGGLASADE